MASWDHPFDHATADSSRQSSSDSHPRFEPPWSFPSQTNQHEYHQYHAAPPAFLPSSEPIPIHPVIDTSTTSTTSNPAPPVGRFIHSQCDQELFNGEYLRSNKASGHKNLRCFPHCCGGHNPKSFCGSGLVVECALPHVHIALGRFEEVLKSPHGSNNYTNAHANTTDDSTTAEKTNDQHGPTPTPTPPAATNNQLHHDPDALPDSFHNPPVDRVILIGRTYARHDLFRELKSSENPFGMWFKGTAVTAPASSQNYTALSDVLPARPRFHLNGNRASWHYGWQSSRLNCKNLHVFRVYFFQSVQSDSDNTDVLQCVGSVGSPPFRISSSRKARKTFKSSPSMQSLADSVSGDDQLSIPQSSPRGTLAASGDDDRLSVDSFDGTTSTNTATRSTMHSRSSFDLGLGFGFGPSGSGSGGGSGDVLPSLSSRLVRATTAAALEPYGGGARHYGAEPDRKRLTRSASLQADYYSSHFGMHGMGCTGTATATRQPRARTFPGDETSYVNQTMPTTTSASPASGAVRSRSGMMSMDSLLNSAPPSVPFPTEPAYRPSLPSIAVPSLTLSHFHQRHSTHAAVTTPVTDMMQLQLSTPRVLPRSLSTSSAVSSSPDFVALRPPRSPTMKATASAGSTTHRPRRKRNRSADAGRDPDFPQTSTHAAWHDGPLMEEIAPDGDWDQVAQAHALGVVVAIASRLQVVQTDATYQVQWKQSTTGHSATATISPDTTPALATMCGVLVTAMTQLIHQTSFLADVRGKMHERIHGRGVHRDDHVPAAATAHHDEGRCQRLITLYEELLAFVLPRIEDQLTRALALSHQPPQTQPSPLLASATSVPSPLVTLLCSAEHELVRERWWRDVTLFDDDDDEYPFMEFFKGYYEAVHGSAAYHPLPVPSSGLGTSLSGTWRLAQASLDELDTSHVRRALAWTPTPWLSLQLAMYESQTYRMVETATRLTLTLDNSVVSSASPFHAELNQRLPVTSVPADHFPFALTRRHLLLAHQAWREATTTAVRVMQWPTENDCRLVRAGDVVTSTMSTTTRRELLRTRTTTYFSLATPTRLCVRFVVEGSVTEDAKLCAMAFAPPNAADMAEYFEAPAAWATLSQSTLTYERA